MGTESIDSSHRARVHVQAKQGGQDRKSKHVLMRQSQSLMAKSKRKKKGPEELRKCERSRNQRYSLRSFDWIEGGLFP